MTTPKSKKPIPAAVTVAAQITDTARMDWLVSMAVEVRTPSLYGSRALFSAQTLTDEDDDYHATDLRDQIDREIHKHNTALNAHRRRRRRNLKRMVRRFYWHCNDCRLSGHVDIRLPDQVRRLHGRLEEDHARKRGPVCCTSDYFEITSISTRETASAKSPGEEPD